MAKRITILLTDDRELVRLGLRALLADQTDLEVVGEAAHGPEAVQATRAHRPDVVVMDFSMPELNGVEATRQLLECDPRLKVVAISNHVDTSFVRPMLEAGAAGYVVKSEAGDELLKAIRGVMRGQTCLSPLVKGILGADQSEGPGRGVGAAGAAGAALTSREREVLHLVAEGRLSKEIAASLNISEKTVEIHRGHIMKKLGLRSVAELTKYAVRAGLSSP